MRRAERLFLVAQNLDSKSGRTLPDLAKRLKFSERTIFRDLAALRDSGVPIVCEDGRYRIREAAGGGPISADSRDLALVRVALSGGAIAKKKGPLHRALTRILSALEGPRRKR